MWKTRLGNGSRKWKMMATVKEVTRCRAVVLFDPHLRLFRSVFFGPIIGLSHLAPLDPILHYD